MDYQQYTGYQTMGYNSAYHYQYATPNHLKVGKKNFPDFYLNFTDEMRKIELAI